MQTIATREARYRSGRTKLYDNILHVVVEYDGPVISQHIMNVRVYRVSVRTYIGG